MKTPVLTQNGTVVPSLFQIAANFEDLVPAAGLKKTVPVSSQTPFAGLLSHPDKLEAALKNARAGNEVSDASRSISRDDGKRTTRNPPAENGGIKTNKARLPRETRKVEFFLEAPSAKSVKLAADFTDWEKCPLEMLQSEDGFWSSVIPLKPGQYSYRFIVDGQWCDDPRSSKRVPNPFGTENAVRVVT